MILPNRIVRSATQEGMTDREGRVTTRYLEYMRRLASGGVGLIVTGHLYVREDGRANRRQAGIHNDGTIPELQRMVGRVHEEGTKIVAQISHAGGQIDTRGIEGFSPVAPSAVSDPLYREVPRALTIEEIHLIIRSFAEAGVRAKTAGFDGVQIHVAHGYLLSQFLSPNRNVRRDTYGGSPDDRGRIVVEVCEETRKVVGPGFPILVKINGEDLVEGGMDHSATLEVSARLASAGVNAIEVSGGLLSRRTPTIFRMKIDSVDDEGYFRAFAKSVKKRTSLPVISVGGYRSPTLIDRLLLSGEIDFIAMSRPFIREPELVNRWRRGDGRRAACISCNRCLRASLSDDGVCCPVEEESSSVVPTAGGTHATCRSQAVDQ